MTREALEHDVRVVKIGGSLLDSTSIERLPSWLRRQTPMHNILVVGGGSNVETIRQTQLCRGLSDRQAHWLSISVMDQNAVAVAERLAGVRFSPQALSDPPVSIARVQKLLLHDVAQENALPQDWSVTSDSISARVAEWASAKELVLLKSKSPTASTMAELVTEGMVDDAFAATFCVGRLRIVNARKAGWPDRSY